MMLMIRIEYLLRPIDRELFEIIFKSFESQRFQFGTLPWWPMPNFSLTRRSGRGRDSDEFDWDLVLTDNDIGIGLEFSAADLEETLSVQIYVMDKETSFLSIMSAQLPRIECRPYEREMALRQQAIAKSLHLGLGGIHTQACTEGDVDRENPWFEFSKTSWKELTEEDLPLVAYDEEDIGIAEDMARGNDGRFPPWYEEAKRVVAERIRREKENGS